MSKNLRRFADRLSTFSNRRDASDWAECGFYFKNNVYQCFYCNCKKSELPVVNVPILQHYKWNPFCSLILIKYGKPNVVEQNVCIVCFENERNIVNLPCKHVVLCQECSILNNSTCVLCRNAILTTVQIYFS